MALGKFHAVDGAAVGRDLGHGEALAAEARGRHGLGRPEAEIAERWAIWREKEKARRRRGRPRQRRQLGRAVRRADPRQAPEDAVISPVDVGNNTYSFGRYFECKRHAVLMSGYLGSIGFGYAAAMGAWCALHGEAGNAGAGSAQRKVIAVTGDGGFGQYLAEVTTAVKYGMDITHVLLNNSELGKISKEQRAAEFDVWQTSLVNPDFSRYAENCGALGIRVTKLEELDAALERALAHDGPATVEVLTDPELI